MRNQILFIGNGLNRIIDTDDKKYFEPEYLLSQIFKNYYTEQKKQKNTEIDFAFLFDTLFNRFLNGKYDSFYNILINNLKDYFNLLEKEGNMKIIREFSKELFSFININDYDAIFTTNYDNNLHGIFGKVLKGKSFGRQGIYKYIDEDKKCSIVHLHGDVLEPQHKICAGYRAYTKLVKRIYSNIKLGNYKDDYKKEDFIKELEKLPEWARVFFTHDIHIIGYSLSKYERDIWSLLTVRSFIKRKYNYIENHIYFYDKCENNSDLIYFDIECPKFNNNSNEKNYKQFYKEVFKYLGEKSL